MQKSKIKTLIKNVESLIAKKDQKSALDQLKKIDSNCKQQEIKKF